MSGRWTPGSWDSEGWVDDTSPVRDTWADAYGSAEAGHHRPGRLDGAAAPAIVLAAGGGAVAATALGLVVLLFGGIVVALIVGAMVLLGACLLGSAYLRGAR